MKAAFYAIDESDSRETGVISMTGVLVPFEKYQQVCGTLIQFVASLIPGTSLHLNPPELHGACLLKEQEWATDEQRIACFRMIVDLVNEQRLVVKRAGYFRHSVKTLLAHDPKLVGLGFSNMRWMIQRELVEYFIVPIVDGLDELVGTRLSASGQSVTALVALGRGPMVSIQPPENMCEPLFTTSKHSVLIQLADMVSYLLHTLDFDRTDHKVSAFKGAVQDEARRLNGELVVNDVVEMDEI
jgi:hypothetical protein